MLILDTDLLSIIQQRRGEIYRRLNECLQLVYEIETVAITIVSLEEQMRGWMAFLNQPSSKRDGGATLVVGYRRLHRLFEDFGGRTVLEFGDRAYEQYHNLKSRKIRIGTMDLRIAAIALLHNATLLTRNTRDFEKIPGLKIEDWTKD